MEYIEPSAVGIFDVPVRHFPDPGSPTSKMWMSPLVVMPSSRDFLTPPMSWRTSDSLIL